jgi:transcriptional regulator with AAA-type ATPase domain
MSLFEPDERSFTEGARRLITTNPFDPNWREQECALLDLPPRDAPVVISWKPGVALWGPQSAYSEELHQRITKLHAHLYDRLRDGASASKAELSQYELVALYCLYNNHGEAIDRFIAAAMRSRDARSGEGRAPQGEKPVQEIWETFRNDHAKWLCFGNLAFPRSYTAEHVFACFFAFRRAFYHIFFNIIGASRPIAELRSRVWESIVTHDFLGWMQGQHQRMKDIPTLITGPSGTGKERVAEAIGRSAYVPFSAEQGFEIDFLDAFNPVNLAALPPLLIESELFGHVKGAFASASRDRVGRLDEKECSEQGAVFLDEIGEVSQEIQVKLLRVLQTRRFQRVGENEDRVFRGKIIAATNRDVLAEMQAGRFREDFYYRLCADQIETPSLREQLADHPDDFPFLVEFVCRSVAGEEKAGGLSGEVVAWVEQNLRDYDWPGNFRELEQCVRSYTIRKAYHPLRRARSQADGDSPRPEPARAEDSVKELANQVVKAEGKLTFDAVKRRLFTEVYRRVGSFPKAGKLLDVDSRTVRASVNGKED